jgi:CBS domain-containing membrane protein
MNAITQRLLHLRAKDIMSREVVVVSANSTMSEAADVLSEHQISGAPVVDELGHCVGVLSGTDYVHRKASHLEPDTGHILAMHTSAGGCQIEDVLHDLVRRHMTPAVQTIDQNTSLLQVSRCMCAEHLHRLIVIDDNSVPVGVVTSLDLVAAIVNATDEQLQTLTREEPVS